MYAKELIYKDDARGAILRHAPALAFSVDRIKAVDAVEVVHGRMCDYCEDNSYGRPCVRALNDMCRAKRISIDYSKRNYEDIWDGYFCTIGERRENESR